MGAANQCKGVVRPPALSNQLTYGLRLNYNTLCHITFSGRCLNYRKSALVFLSQSVNKMAPETQLNFPHLQYLAHMHNSPPQPRNFNIP
jgi:hypothetical protein